MKRPGHTCVVLGAGGFLGTNLCRRLVASGHSVRAFGRSSLYPDELKGAEWIAGEFDDASALASALDGCKVVFHLVHTTTPQAANLDMAGDVGRNVIPSIAMLDLCRKLGVSRVVFVSSGGTIYGHPGVIPTPETAATQPITAYAISKLAIEKYLSLYQHLYGLDYRVLRVTNPFGPFQHTRKSIGLIAALLSRSLRGEEIEIWGDGSVVRDFIYVDDVIDALEAAATDRGSERIYNIGSGQGRSVREVIEAIERQLGRTLEINWRPGRAVDVPVSVVAIERARLDLGWTPKTPFDVGLQKTIDWWARRLAEERVAGA